jgi:GT2 family glycosyltransferase
MPVGVLKATPWKKSKTRQLNSPVFKDLIVSGHAINTSSVLVRREYMEKINGFSEDRDLIAAEDFDAWLRLARLTNKFYRIPECLGYYEVGGNNLSNARRTVINLEKFCNMYSADINQFAKKRPHWISYALGISYFKTGHYQKATYIFLEINFLKNYLYSLLMTLKNYFNINFLK